MAGSNGNAGYSTLGVRVDTVEKGLAHIDARVMEISDSMATKRDIESIMSRIESIGNAQTVRIEAISTAQNLAGKPNYSLMTSVSVVIVMVMSALGALAYSPISASNIRQEAALTALANVIVPQKQYDADQSRVAGVLTGLRTDLSATTGSTIQQQRYNADMKHLEDTISTLIPRAEFADRHHDLELSIDKQEQFNQVRFTAVVRRLERLEDILMVKSK